jgi:ATP-dependent Clp protease adapter protein ClpS
MILRLGCLIAAAAALTPSISKLPRPVARAARPPATMSQTQKSNKSKLQTIVKDKVEEDTKTKEDLNIEEPWRLLLHNDDVHTFEYVTYMIQKIIPTVSNAKAYQLTMTTHCEGVSTVTQTAKPLAQKYCVQLQKGGLTASISPDSNFKNNREGGGDDGPDTA